jgi:predicted DNA-binding transcriptional regulator YafY
MPAVAKIDELLRAAIQQKRLVELIYKEKTRIIEPHDYGVHNGSVKLLGYQVGGSSSGRLPNWRWMEVDSISDLRLLNRTFRGGRPGSGKHHGWDQLFLRVKPPEDEQD